jgi:hypothetical protein
MDEEERRGSNHLAREGIHDGFFGVLSTCMMMVSQN